MPPTKTQAQGPVRLVRQSAAQAQELNLRTLVAAAKTAAEEQCQAATMRLSQAREAHEHQLGLVVLARDLARGQRLEVKKQLDLEQVCVLC